MFSFFFDYSELWLAALNAGIAVAIGIQLRQLGIRVTGPAGALLVFFALRAAGRLVDAPQLPPTPNSGASQAIYAMSIAAALYLLTQTRQLVESFRQGLDEARMRHDEYERARHHYTQVVRHRMVNPLTVINGTLLTLRDGPTLDRSTHIKLCDSALTASHDLEGLTLDPARRDELEHELDAIPRPHSRTDDPPMPR